MPAESPRANEAVEQLPDITVQLTWGKWDVTTLLLVFLAGAYAFNTLELGRYVTSPQEPAVDRNETTSTALLPSALCFLLVILHLGALRPLRGGKGYDHKDHAAKGLKEALIASAKKIFQLLGPITASGSSCLQLFANLKVMSDFAQSGDWAAFSVKFFMLVLMSSMAALYTYWQTPSALKKMPPLGLRPQATPYLPLCVASLAFFQLLPATLILLHLLLFIASYDAAELERARSIVHIPQIFTVLQDTSLVTQNISDFFLNIELLTGTRSTELSQTSWHALFISTLNTGRSLTLTFAEIDKRDAVSYTVKGLPTVVGSAPQWSGVFAFVVLYRAATVFASGFLLWAFQRSFASGWSGVVLLALDFLLQSVQVWRATQDWRKLPLAVWGLLSPPEPLLHSGGQPLLACKSPLQWALVKTLLAVFAVSALFVLKEPYGLEMEASHPVLKLIAVFVVVQWPLLISLRNASYPDVQDDHLLRWWKKCSRKEGGLVFPSWGFGDEDMEGLRRLLEADKTIEELDLDLTNNDIGHIGFGSLCEAVSRHPNLKKGLMLNLNGNPLGEHSVVHLLSLAKPISSVNLTLLSLSRTGLGPNLKPLADFLVNTKTLKTLHLNCNDIPPKGAELLAEGLGRNTSLQVLTLNKNGLQDGMLAIFRALAESRASNLGTLCIPENGIDDLILQGMLQHLKKFRVPLEFLNLAENSFALRNLAEAVEKHQLREKMREVEVSIMHPGDEEAAKLLQQVGVDVKRQYPNSCFWSCHYRPLLLNRRH